jgi:hypothetical protein
MSLPPFVNYVGCPPCPRNAVRLLFGDRTENLGQKSNLRKIGLASGALNSCPVACPSGCRVRFTMLIVVIQVWVTNSRRCPLRCASITASGMSTVPLHIAIPRYVLSVNAGRASSKARRSWRAIERDAMRVQVRSQGRERVGSDRRARESGEPVRSSAALPTVSWPIGYKRL